MPLLVRSVLRHKLKGSAGYRDAADGAIPPAWLRLQKDEAFVGTYRNPPPWEVDSLIFTTLAIHASVGRRRFQVLLSDVVGYELPPKEDTMGVTIRTVDGFRFLRMAGTHGPKGKFKDAFHLVNFLVVLCRQNERLRALQRQGEVRREGFSRGR